ncbi:50S ribosomal protein L18 [bacterium]|nr:50S ribosomal protein L18 [bacterium]
MEKRRFEMRKKRHFRVRKNIFGVESCPRLCVYKSSKHTYVQIIDDEKGNTLVACSTLSSEIKEKISYSGNIAAAEKVGNLIAEKAKKLGIKKIVFDRGGYLYHGKVKALAEAARKSGLNF